CFSALRTPLSSCDKFVKHAPLLRYVLIWKNPSCNELPEQLSRNEHIDAKPLTTQVQLGIPPRHLSASALTHWDLIQRRYTYGLLFIWVHLIL
ncbi:hypothetical protein AVEN_199298-1, partial [Araneus ventricosus]